MGIVRHLVATKYVELGSAESTKERGFPVIYKEMDLIYYNPELTIHPSLKWKGRLVKTKERYLVQEKTTAPDDIWHTIWSGDERSLFLSPVEIQRAIL